MLENILENIFSNMEAPIVFLIVALGLRVANIILGSIDAMLRKNLIGASSFPALRRWLWLA